MNSDNASKTNISSSNKCKPPGNKNAANFFDLNIEKILENWEVFHAIREIIANALDEQILTGTKDISIIKDKNGCWHIIDYGRGLNYHHLTQNENDEKLNNDKLIGRFGVGLKDALATLYRHNIKVRISSKYATITLSKFPKAGFEDINTLQAEINEPEDCNMIGTDFCLSGCTDQDIEKAKSLFLKFSKDNILENTVYGSVIEKSSKEANIYINGVKVAQEPNFLFSYNITSLNAKLKKALNRERTNVGRSAYTDRIKAILLHVTQSNKVIKSLIDDLQNYGNGTMHDELNWQDVQIYAAQQLKRMEPNSSFISFDDLQNSPDAIDELKRENYNPCVIPANLLNKINEYNDNPTDGNSFNTITTFWDEKRSNFKPNFISIKELTKSEKKVYSKTKSILALIGGKPKQVKDICITDKIYGPEYFCKTLGLWQPDEQRILILREQLSSVSEYAGTLLHECAHAISGASDVNRDFESGLTKMLGHLAAKIVKS